MKKRLFTLLLAASLTALALPGCTKETAQETAADTEVSKSTGTAGADTSEDAKDSDSTAAAAEKEKIHVRLNEVAHSIFYAPMYAAIEEGYFEEEGIDLELTCGFGADKVMTAVLSGEADIGFMGSESSIYTYNEGANDYVVDLTSYQGISSLPGRKCRNLRGTTLRGN